MISPVITPFAERLLAEAFRQTPTFRVSRFDAHVKAWRNETCAEIWRSYHADPDFRAVYEARVAELHAEPMPAWRTA